MAFALPQEIDRHVSEILLPHDNDALEVTQLFHAAGTLMQVQESARRLEDPDMAEHILRGVNTHAGHLKTLMVDLFEKRLTDTSFEQHPIMLDDGREYVLAIAEMDGTNPLTKFEYLLRRMQYLGKVMQTVMTHGTAELLSKEMRVLGQIARLENLLKGALKNPEKADVKAIDELAKELGKNLQAMAKANPSSAQLIQDALKELKNIRGVLGVSAMPPKVAAILNNGKPIITSTQARTTTTAARNYSSLSALTSNGVAHAARGMSMPAVAAMQANIASISAARTSPTVAAPSFQGPASAVATTATAATAVMALASRQAVTNNNDAPATSTVATTAPQSTRVTATEASSTTEASQAAKTSIQQDSAKSVAETSQQLSTGNLTQQPAHENNQQQVVIAATALPQQQQPEQEKTAERAVVSESKSTVSENTADAIHAEPVRAEPPRTETRFNETADHSVTPSVTAPEIKTTVAVGGDAGASGPASGVMAVQTFSLAQPKAVTFLGDVKTATVIGLEKVKDRIMQFIKGNPCDDCDGTKGCCTVNKLVNQIDALAKDPALEALKARRLNMATPKAMR